MISATNRYTVYGALFGACFPLFATLLAAWLWYGSVAPSELLIVQRSSPLLWIIDSAPFWLGLFARFGGIQLDRLQTAHGQLQLSEQRFRSVVDQLGEGVLLADLDGLVTYANARAADLLDWKGDPAGRTVDALLRRTAPVAQTAYETLELARAGADPSSLEVRHSTVQAAGAAAERVTVLTDVTDRARLEEQLRHVQKMEAVGQLAGGIAHDFNNLLTAIGGFNAMLDSELESDDPRREYTREIGRATARSVELTRDLLAYGRKQVLQPRVFCVNEVLTGLEPMLRRLIGVDIDLVVRPRGGLPPVVADPGKLEQVLVNLIVNARDAMADGGRLLVESDIALVSDDHTRFRDQLEPGAYVRVRVTDTGCGMDRETIQRIFEPFYTTKPLGKGTGLGLSTVYGIVKQTGGHIDVVSQPGHGTQFDVHLPCAESAVPVLA